MADDSQPTRATVASVDGRVAALETALGLVQLEQKHLKELMTSRFTAIETAIGAHGQKLDGFITRMETMILEATKSSGDLTSSPAGRQVHERLVALETQQRVDSSFLDQMRGMGKAMTFVIGTSVIGFLMGLASILKMAGLWV